VDLGLPVTMDDVDNALRRSFEAVFDDQAANAPGHRSLRRRTTSVVAAFGRFAVACGLAVSTTGQVLLIEDPPEPDVLAPLTADGQTTRAALLLLNDAVTVQIDGRHHTLLRALRHLKDPALKPLFAGLSAVDRHPSLRIHGVLGAAELSASSTLSLDTIAQIRRPDLQAELISAALDGRLLDESTLDTLLGWPALDPAVKLLLATPRVAAGTFGPESAGYPAMLKALDAAALGQRGLAGLLLHELDDPRGTAALDALNAQTGSSAEAVTAMLLETAWTHGLRRSGGWALRVAEREATAERVRMLAYKVAVRFGQPGADRSWADRVARAAADRDLSQRTRLALVGLKIAPWLDAARFDGLAEDEDALIARLGRAGRAVAVYRKSAAAADTLEAAVGELLESAHPQAWRWAADYAEETGSAALARAVVEKYQPGEAYGRSRRLEAVVNATRVLIENDDDAADFFVESLSNPRADGAWRRAVLLGLIRDGGDPARQIAERLPGFTNRDTEALVLVLRTASAEALSETDRPTLERLIQDRNQLDDSLRVQTAWAYLARTGQGPSAVAALLAPRPPASAAEVRSSP
ncbi:MAG: hypothetical protein AAGL98_03170, partial [Planctomycetota bacterium]